MNKFLYAVPLLISSVFMASSATADLDAGLKAFEAEDYATALREFTEDAEKGVALAQFNDLVAGAHGADALHRLAGFAVTRAS